MGALPGCRGRDRVCANQMRPPPPTWFVDRWLRMDRMVAPLGVEALEQEPSEAGGEEACIRNVAHF